MKANAELEGAMRLRRLHWAGSEARCSPQGHAQVFGDKLTMKTVATGPINAIFLVPDLEVGS
jgi:hypothetical protein